MGGRVRRVRREARVCSTCVRATTLEGRREEELASWWVIRRESVARVKSWTGGGSGRGGRRVRQGREG